MALGAVLSSRCFGSPFVSGKECQLKQIIPPERRPNLPSNRGQFYLRRGYIKSMQRERCHICRALSPHPSKLVFNPERNLPSKTKCGGLNLRKLGITTRAKYQPEQYEIAGVPLEPIGGEPIEEVVLPWWQQFPKRWTVVLLCFFAFLLCNMDRVNMSIAILPMSAEFNWSPATVGLIQSSFFWGYLLTQILGGIWADKFGGKIVLGFGVVWWSIATILTPLAAKVSLPCLLIMRAFMGIGELKIKKGSPSHGRKL